MKVLITGICGFAGSSVAKALKEAHPNVEIFGVDNLSRAGSYLNKAVLKEQSIHTYHADVRQWSDVESLPKSDWVIDAAANPSVLAGVDGATSSRQLIEHNLYGTVNLLEYAKRHDAGITILSSSRVYSINALCQIPLKSEGSRFQLAEKLPSHVTSKGVGEEFPTDSPISLYGTSKLCSELLAQEYGQTFDFPVFINRIGVMAGEGQFGRPDQGIFTYWINCYLRRRPLKYIGFEGRGKQVRDCLHPRDLVPLLHQQMTSGKKSSPVINVSGGIENSMSLKELSDWCSERFGSHTVASDPTPRTFDVPWLILDYSRAESMWGFKPATPISSVLEEIARHAEANPDWLTISNS